jgi:LysM repeat protein
LPENPSPRLISSLQEPSSLTVSTKTRNAYIALGIAAFSVAGISALILVLPRHVGAFWPFSKTEAATVAAADAPILHNTEIDLLRAAMHPDPNPSKGGPDITMTGGTALMANSGPEGTVADIVPATGGGRISIYEVREGDSLSEISEMFDVTNNTILWANDLKSASSIRPGMSLLILPVSGVKHKVGKGETLAGIAKKYAADANDVASFNGLEEGAALAVGTEVIIPGGEVQAPKATKTVAKAKGSSAASRALPAISGFFGNPLPGGRISQGIHGYNGIDIAAPSGTPIYAAAGGKVIVAKGGGGYNGGYGNYVVIDHGNGTQTLYAHMTTVSASAGSVAKGSLIGTVGNTGRSTGNHLHFEVRGAKNPFAN